MMFPSKMILDKISGVGVKKKILMLVLILPVILLSALMVIEKLFKFVRWFMNGLVDMINYMTSKDHRAVYMFTIVLTVIAGALLEYNFTFVERGIDFCNDNYNVVKDYIEYFIEYMTT